MGNYAYGKKTVKWFDLKEYAGNQTCGHIGTKDGTMFDTDPLLGTNKFCAIVNNSRDIAEEGYKVSISCTGSFDNEGCMISGNGRKDYTYYPHKIVIKDGKPTIIFENLEKKEEREVDASAYVRW